MNGHPLPVLSPRPTLAPRRLGLKDNHGAVSMRLGKPLRLLAAAATLAASSTLCAAPAINVLTGGTSGVYYPIGVALAQLYSDGIAGAETTVRATKASVENLNLLQIGRGQLAFALSSNKK